MKIQFYVLIAIFLHSIKYKNAKWKMACDVSNEMVEIAKANLPKLSNDSR
jgi:hypothetical protein